MGRPAQPGSTAGDINPAAVFAAANQALADGDYDAAVAEFRRVLAVAPDVVEIHNNLANALLALDRVDEAIAIAEDGVARRADFLPLCNTLGNAYSRAGWFDAAIRQYERALEMVPEFDDAAVNLADLLRRTGELALAAGRINQVLRRRPDNPQALLVLALVQMDAGEHDRAADTLTEALQLAPGLPAAVNNLAICLTTLGRSHQALALYRDLAGLHPDLVQVQVNLGQVLQGLGRHDEAVDTFRHALALDPGDDVVPPLLLQSLMHQCAWAELEPLATRVLDDARAAVVSGRPAGLSPFALSGTEAPADLRLAVARQYADRCVARMQPLHRCLSFMHRRGAGGPLRVGYVSPDFREHSVAVSFLPLLEAHARDGFEWYGYWVGQEPADEVTDAFLASFDHFRDLRAAGPEQIARTIHGDGISVLIDLAGHTRHSVLEAFELRPAPVQAHYLGYGSTIGADCISYLITDQVHTPPALVPFCHEKLVYLPDSFMAAGRAAAADGPVSRTACGLPDDGIVFACFNAHYKIDADLFAAWMRMLAACDGSVLWLKAGTEVATKNLRTAAIRAGIDPGRLVFAQRAPHAEHLARHRLADLALDTRLHVGGVTTLDALWAGVPVLTIAGATHAGRTGASMLRAAGLPDLVVASLDAYVERAVALAGDANARTALRARIAAAIEAAPLFDAGRLARHLEWAYVEMARRWRAGRAPASFHVPHTTS